MKRTLTLIALFALLLLALAACEAATPLPGPAPVGLTPVSQATTSAAVTVPTAAPVAQATPPAGAAAAASATPVAPSKESPPTTAVPATPGGAPKASVLLSYVAQIELKQDMVKPTAAPVSWITMTMRYQSQNYAIDVADKLTPGQTGSTMKMVIAGKDSYLWTPEQDGKWLKTDAQGADAASAGANLLDPNRLAQDAPAGIFVPANLIGTEQVGGVTAMHYRAKDALLGQLIDKQSPGDKLVSGQADFWVAAGYIKQYTLDAVTQDDTGQQVRAVAKLLVTGENKNVAIATPVPADVMTLDLFNQPAQQAPGQTAVPSGGLTSAGGKAALKALAAPPQSRVIATTDLSAAVRQTLPAYDVAGVPDVLYATTAKAADLVTFFKGQASKQGWNEVMSQTGNNTLQQPTLLMYNQGSLNLMIAILPDAKLGNVVLVQVEG